MLALWLLLLSAACAPLPAAVAPTATLVAVPITLSADGQTRTLLTTARTVGEALAQAGVALAPADEIDPPPATPLLAGAAATPLAVTVVRITETTEVIPEAIPFGRQIVRSAELSPDDPPRLLQAGRPGLREVTVRIVYRDGLEVERWPTATTIVEPAQDEIVMIGVIAASDRMAFDGTLAYIDGGRAVLLEGATDAPRQLAIEGALDGRVFQLSPAGDYLLYTAAVAENTDTFRNALWIMPTAAGSVAQPLNIENVLWAGWDPTATPPRIAYTTARSTTLPPGWEASNDLWLLELTLDADQPAPVRLVESYPAAYAWWGGVYSWSNDGRLAYAFADEVGVLTMPTSEEAAVLDPTTAAPARVVLHEFPEFDTGGDWAWLPALSWSADGRLLAFTDHAAATGAASERFDLRLADLGAGSPADAGSQTALVDNVGIWAAAQWSPATLPEQQLATLQAIDPEAGQDGSYALWLAGSDGGDARRIYPPEGESGAFARSQPLAWGPDGNRLAFIFDHALHIIDLASGEVYRASRDDTISSHPTWAPYGPGGD